MIEIKRFIRSSIQKDFILDFLNPCIETKEIYILNTPIAISSLDDIEKQFTIICTITFMERPIKLTVEYNFDGELFTFKFTTNYQNTEVLKRIFERQIDASLEKATS